MSPMPAARRLLLIALALSAGGLALTSPAPAAPWSPVASGPLAQKAGTAHEWTRADLLAAKPAEVRTPATAFDLPEMPDASASVQTGDFVPGDVTALPLSLHGKIFFRIGADLYECSGTLVDSRRGNVVFTAGHCVFDTASKKFVTDLIFVPGYQDGETPLGSYAAARLVTTQGFSGRGDLSYDIGLISLKGSPEADLGGSRRLLLDINPNGRDYLIYGYPALPDPPYDGERLIGCDARVTSRDPNRKPRALAATPCDMQQGASGGGWITRGNFLNSVVSYGYCDQVPDLCGVILGPYFAKAARSLYNSEAIGGSVNPTLKLLYAPPRKVDKRKVLFRFSGEGSTPISFRCKFDQRKLVRCGSRTTVSRLTPGRHTLRVRSIDQTGRYSSTLITRSWRVVKKKR